MSYKAIMDELNELWWKAQKENEMPEKAAVQPDQWSDPFGRNISVNDFNALVAAMGEGVNFNGYGFELISTQVQAWAPIEAGATPGGPGGGFLEGYNSLKQVQLFIPDPGVPLAIMARWNGFGAGNMATYAFASDVAAAFYGAAKLGDIAVGTWYETVATPAFNLFQWYSTLMSWRELNQT